MNFCRTPRWVRGLKFFDSYHILPFRSRRTPRWVRGLKSSSSKEWLWSCWSHPTMGAWIEICWKKRTAYQKRVAPHDGCVDWNCYWNACNLSCRCRTPRWVRGLKFIKICRFRQVLWVAPYEGCVDWNETYCLGISYQIVVAPHKGCVDWNCK